MCFITVFSWCFFWCSESCSHFGKSLHASITKVILQFDSIRNLHCRAAVLHRSFGGTTEGRDLITRKNAGYFCWSALVKYHELHLNRQHPECVAVHVQNISGMTFISSISQDAFQRMYWFLFLLQDTFLFSTGCSRWCGYRTDYWYHSKGPAGRLAQFVGGKQPL